MTQEDLGPWEKHAPGRNTAPCQQARGKLSNFAERPNSAAAAALRALKLRKTSIAAAVCCSVWFGTPTASNGSGDAKDADDLPLPVAERHLAGGNPLLAAVRPRLPASDLRRAVRTEEK